MKKVSIIIPHLESFQFLKGCLEGIERMKHPDIEHEIIIVDDNSTDDSFKKILQEYGNKYIVLQTKRTDKRQNAGYPLDFALPYITGDYVCSFDCDCVPISNDWLTDPISKVDQGYVFAGRNSNFADPYMNRFAKNNPDFTPFVIIDNCYRVSTYNDYKTLSDNVGFRVHGTISHEYDFYQEKYNPIQGHSDSGVACNYYVYDTMKRKNYSYKITKVTGGTPTDGSFGQNIEDKVFHMALATRFISKSRKDLGQVGENYQYYLDKIMNDYLTEDILNEMLENSSELYNYLEGVDLDC